VVLNLASILSCKDVGQDLFENSP